MSGIISKNSCLNCYSFFMKKKSSLVIFIIRLTQKELAEKSNSSLDFDFYFLHWYWWVPHDDWGIKINNKCLIRLVILLRTIAIQVRVILIIMVISSLFRFHSMFLGIKRRFWHLYHEARETMYAIASMALVIYLPYLCLTNHFSYSTFVIFFTVQSKESFHHF